MSAHWTLPGSLLLGCALSLACQAGPQPAALPTASVDEDSNTLTVTLPGGAGSATSASHSLGAQVLDGSCVGRVEGQDYVFVFADGGYLAQWRIDPADASVSLVRDLPGTLEVEACVVSGHSLYLLSEDSGLWRHGAHPESDPQRQLVEPLQPHGRIPPGTEDLALVDGVLVAGQVRVQLQAEPPSATRVLPLVAPSGETEPVRHRGDAADDAAIWRNARDPARSLILAADKRFGLRVYDLSGSEVDNLPVGRLNNVDLRELQGHDRLAAIAAGSNRTHRSISLFAIGHDGSLRHLAQDEIATGLDDPYGLCMYRDARGLFVFVNDKDGRFQQWRLALAGESVDARLVREFSSGDQPEGCAGDDHHGRLFFGVEDHGLKALQADTDGEPEISMLAAADERTLYADVEGMDLYRAGDGGYLVVSSQGDNSYAVFERLPPHRYRGSFRIGANAALGIDGASETDGLSVHAGHFGDAYPAGILVVQDGHNVAPPEPQNFKLVDWRDVARALGL
ncbi:MAG: hypothetical protein CME59_12580 [Halioglobus sp.]|nr:hypothetical protein [Halioglobus sp.]